VRRGHDRVAVLPLLRHQDDPHAHVHAHGAAARRRVRGERVRQADRRGRGRAPPEPDQGRQPEQRADLRRRQRRGARLLAAAREVPAGRGLHHRRRAHDDGRRDARRADRHGGLPHPLRGGSCAGASVGRHAADSGHLEVPRRDGLGAEGSSRDHAARPPLLPVDGAAIAAFRQA
jgi:hypothetical protein